MGLHGIFGRPYASFPNLIGEGVLREVDREVTSGLAQAPCEFTGGTLKWMGVVAPWVMEDGYRDAMSAIQAMNDSEWLEWVSLSEDTENLTLAKRDECEFGDETDYPFTMDQARLLAYRHGVYFPWKVCVHLLANDRWEDKHHGIGKSFSKSALELFPKTVEMVRALPFKEVGRVVIFGMNPNDHAPLHRDSEPGKSLRVAQCISVDPRGNKGLYLQNAPNESPVVVNAKAYWFNDMDYHGVFPAPFFRYSIRADGVFDDAFLRDVERNMRRAS